MPHNLSTLSLRCFIELIFGGGWCILGETALENSLQSNKQKRQKRNELGLQAIYKHPLLVSDEKGY